MALTRPLLDQINTNKADLSDNLIRINSSSDTADKDVGFILNRDGGISENIAITWKEESNVIVFGYTTSTGEQAEEVVEFTGNIGIDVGSVVINGVSIEVDPVTKKLTVDGVEVSGGGGGTANIYQLPSITDFPAEGTEDSLYIAKDTGILYRWDESVSDYVATGFEDAPSDGKQYVRKDGEWVEDLSSGIRLPDAHGFLDPSIISAIQSTYTDYVYLVDIGGDLRFDQSVPPELAGDQSGNIIKWETGVGWKSVGRFTGEQGPEGIGLRILGSLPDVPSLPTDGNEAGDSFIVQENMYVWDGASWKKLSQVGPPGKSAYEIAIQTGSITSNVSQAAWIASLKGKDAYETAIEVGAIPPSASKSDFIEYLRGEDGQSAYQIAVSEGGFVGTIFQWLESLRGDVGPEGPQGPQGPQGPMGAGIHILGKLNDESELPPSSDIGNGYMIGADFHVWNGDEWQNVGPIQGPEGPQGPQGVAGAKGDPGLSAYDLAALSGEIDPGEVSVTDWIRSLKGNTGQSAYEAAIEENIISSDVSRLDWLLSLQGSDGGNAYVVAVENGFSGNVEEWLESIRGPQGIQGFTGNTGANAYVVATQNGFVGSVEDWLESLVGATGEVGASAYEIAVDNGFVGTESDWLESLKGIDGIDGKSAYEVAVDNGFVGSESDWLASLKGIDGIDGKSAYEVAVDNGFVGSESDWLASLRGLKGDAGASLILSGRVATVGELPSIAEENDAYVVGEDLYAYIDGNWENLGRIAGESAYEVAVHSGFTGNVEEWLESLVGPQGVQGIQGDKGDKGDTGTGLVLKGTVPSIGDLPNDAAEGDAYTIDGNIYTNVNSNWVDGGRIIGLSAYEVAVNDGFSGSIADWLNSLIGPQGIQGETGANAYVVALDNGFVGSEVDWLDSLVGETGANAYVVALDNGFVGSEVDWLESLKGQNAYQLAVSKGFEGSVEDWLNSLEGDSAYQIAVANGFVGTVEDWLASIKGDVGNAFIISGNVSSVDDLPAPSYDGLSYFVNKNLYTVVNGSWTAVANLEGPQGKSAYEETKETYPSEVQTFEDFIEFIRGNTGNSVVMKGTLDSAADLANIVDPEVGHVYATEYQLYFWDGTNWISSGSLRGAQGPQGPQGPMGAGIHIIGKLNDESELPPSSDIGNGYMIGADFHVWNGDEWQNVGPIQGPEGPQGPQGPQGIQGPIGPTGPQGPRGSRWIVLEGNPSFNVGDQFDYYINSLTNEYFYKTSLTNWVSMGYLGGGNVYKPAFDGNPKVMIDGEWENLDDGLALSKFKTINGESILGTGNIVINAIDVETLVWQGI